MALASCDWLEATETTYANYGAAAKAGEMTRGWIPDYVPHSAVDIRIRYDIENTRTWLFFHTKIDDLPSMLGSCSALSQDDVAFPVEGPRGWWPIALTTDPSSKADMGYEHYQCRNNEYLAVNRKQSEVYLWRL